ncbi:hypothetical protein VF04_04295 [Nostoc linckia z7]|uniref:Uncharacterized protein n=2 Tax=Nostoc linckia TaxID=92942 RepID=A0A9Q6EN38_NOSLI|nr:hypothetical protein [Nostoc linckia]PHK42933.1 hypothetical protein VF12_00995 [Nostoc linckia z15]PHK48090.1 hypothetical protein VF13_01970 [Nostoc linckia z16]PHJ65010.1 hypothetical protein VF02_11780 [Nostoc linckia z1]PHJ70188.1 hypothetical protein VF05_11940 [Nostoc linckia z3]PHJ75089.1 hypothetical protein VF03_12100 [Nostoc linckia z2]
MVNLLSYTIPVKPPISQKQLSLTIQEQALEKAFHDGLIAEHEYLVGLRIIRNSDKILEWARHQVAQISRLPKVKLLINK